LLAEPPIKVRIAGDTDAPAADDNRGRRSRLHFDAPSDALTVEAQVNSKRIAQSAWSTRQPSDLIGPPSLLHHLDSSRWLNRPNQDRPRALTFSREIQAIVHSVDKINVDVRECLLHNRGLLRASYRVRSRVGGVRFSLDDPALARTNCQNRPDEIARDFYRVASEEFRRKVGHLRVSLSMFTADSRRAAQVEDSNDSLAFPPIWGPCFFLLPALPAVL
jgi:hypothetical protein